MTALRITFVNRSLAVGGAERQLVQLARGLADRGYDVAIVVLYSLPGFEASLEGTGVRLVCLGKTSRWHILGWLGKFQMEMRSRCPHIVVGWKPAEALVAYFVNWIAGRQPFVWSIRASNVQFDDYDWLTELVYRLHRWAVRAGTGDAVVFNSFAGAEFYRMAPDGNRFRVIWNSIDTELFRPNEELRQEFRTLLGACGQQSVILLLARISPMKDQETFLRAARRIISSGANALFVIAGSGTDKDRIALDRTAKELGIADSVVLMDKSAQPSGLLNAADIVVSSSRDAEGVQNALIEAMACGKPVVATRVGDAGRYLSEWDSLVPVRSPDSLAAAVLEQLSVSPDAMREGRIARAKTLFSQERACDEFEEVIRYVSR